MCTSPVLVLAISQCRTMHAVVVTRAAASRGPLSVEQENAIILLRADVCGRVRQGGDTLSTTSQSPTFTPTPAPAAADARRGETTAPNKAGDGGGRRGDNINDDNWWTIVHGVFSAVWILCCAILCVVVARRRRLGRASPGLALLPMTRSHLD